MRLFSPAFEHNAEIPQKYTCEGSNVSPPLEWSGVPAGTESLALIIDDPDAPDPAAPTVTWVHWVLIDLPKLCTGLPEGIKNLPNGSSEGLNDWKRASYGGPCPPIGRHRYAHKLYALDTRLSLERPTKVQVEKAMQGHILAQATLVGTYEKKQR